MTIEISSSESAFGQMEREVLTDARPLYSELEKAVGVLDCVMHRKVGSLHTAALR